MDKLFEFIDERYKKDRGETADSESPDAKKSKSDEL